MRTYIKDVGGTTVIHTKGQDRHRERVLWIFQQYPNTMFAAHRIWEGYLYHFEEEIDHSSCRRTITNLTRDGLLIKLHKGHMITGPKGRPVRQWIIKNAENENIYCKS